MGHPNGYRPYGRNVKNNATTEITQEAEIIYLSLEEATKVWLSLQIKDGHISAVEADKLWKQAKTGWGNNGREAARIFADHFSNVKTLGLPMVLSKDLGKHVGQAYLKNYGANTHIIFKGSPRNRRILTGTKYSLKNPKIISLGIGKDGIRSASRKGGILSIILVSGFNIADFVLNDNVTISRFTANMAVDIGIVVASTAIGVVLTGALIGAGVITSVVVGPILAVIFITAVSAWALGALEKKFKIKEKLATALDAAYEAKAAQARALKNSAKNSAANFTANVVKFLIKEGSNAAWNRLSRAIPRRYGPMEWMQF